MNTIQTFMELFDIKEINSKYKHIQLFYPFRIKFMKIAVHAHLNDLKFINLVLS